MDLELQRAHASLRNSLFGEPVAPIRIAHYALLETLGVGGMGVVFAAHDSRLDRTIAIKLMRRELVDTTDAALRQARLVREAQAMAQLSHPNVVQIYEVGVHDEQVYVAMELVRGATLRAWLAERARSTAEVLEVFAQIGRGLVAVHAAGLVHRDIKPDNLMIGADGRVRVMDFGLVRANPAEPGGVQNTCDDEVLRTGVVVTQGGRLIGTPAYMSPEQYLGEAVDARSDQFSYCIALYEALYGARPFPGATRRALAEQITAAAVADAPPGARVSAALRRVLLRGLAAAPSRRWPSMVALLGELARAGRGRSTAVKAAAVGVLAIGLGGYAIVHRDSTPDVSCTDSAAELAGVWDDAARSRVEQALVATAHAFAQGTWERVRTQLDGRAEAWVVAHTEACQASARGEQSEQQHDRRVACLALRKSELAALVEVLGDADAEAVGRASAAAAALPSVDRCADVDALQHELAPPDDPVLAAAVADVRARMARVDALARTGRAREQLAQAIPLVDEARALGHEPLLAEALLRRGSAESALEQLAESEATFDEAWQVAQRSGHELVALRLALQLASLLSDELDRPEQALQWLRSAEALVDRLALGGVDRFDVLHQRGLIEGALGHRDEALDWLRRALAHGERELGPDDPDLARCLLHISHELSERGDLVGALEHVDRALAIGVQGLGPGHPQIGIHRVTRGGLMYELGRYDDAQVEYEAALAIIEASLGREHPRVATILQNLAVLQMDRGQLELAERGLRRSLAVQEQHRPADHPDLAPVHDGLGSVLSAMGRSDEAVVHFRRSVEIFERAYGPMANQLAHALSNLGAELLYDDTAQSKQLLLRASSIYETNHGLEHGPLAYALANLAVAERLMGQRTEAERDALRALVLFERWLGPDHPDSGGTLHSLTRLAHDRGDTKAAIGYAERNLALRDRIPGALLERGRARFELAKVLWPRKGERARALALAEEAADLLREQGDIEPELLTAIATWRAERR